MKHPFKSIAAAAALAVMLPLQAQAQAAAQPAPTIAANTLIGWASLPGPTFSPGPVSGQFIGAGPFNDGHVPPFPGQPVQGFSAILQGPVPGTFYLMSDNGFGGRANSPDALLRVYAARIDWATRSLQPVHFTTGAPRTSFDRDTFITLHDPDRRLGYPIVADRTHYVAGGDIAVDPTIRDQRLLTGSDLDPESIRRDRHGNFWFGEEFGPFVVQTDASGRVLTRELALPGVISPDSPYLAPGQTTNLPRSRGFEGMALSHDGSRLLTMLEGTVTGDPAGTVRINEIDLASGAYTSFQALYRMDPAAAAIGDFTAVDERRFLVIERDGGQGATARFKRVFLADLGARDADGFVAKTEVADLMNIADPDDLNGDGSTTFTFPFVTIESVLLVDWDKLLITNDNNFPFSNGRTAGVADNNEFMLLQLTQPVPEPEAWAMLLAGLGLTGWAVRRRRATAALA
jgi:hypothetical protein